MASDAEDRIIRLLTELRDERRADLAYREKAGDDSLALQKRALRLQRIGPGILFAVLLAGAGSIALAQLIPVAEPPFRSFAERFSGFRLISAVRAAGLLRPSALCTFGVTL